MTVGFEVYGESGNTIISSTHPTYTCIQSYPSTSMYGWAGYDYFNANLLPTDIMVHQGEVYDQYFEELGDNQYLLIGSRVLVYRETVLVSAPLGGFGLEVLSQTGEVLYSSSNPPLTFWQGHGDAAIVYQNPQYYWAIMGYSTSVRYSYPFSVNSAGVVSSVEQVTGVFGFGEMQTPISGISSIPRVVDVSHIPTNYNHPSVSPPLTRFYPYG